MHEKNSNIFFKPLSALNSSAFHKVHLNGNHNQKMKKITLSPNLRKSNFKRIKNLVKCHRVVAYEVFEAFSIIFS